MIKAVFFDFDGVLCNSKMAHDSAWLKAIETILKVKVEVLPSDKISGKAPKLIAKTLCDLYNQSSKHEDFLAFKNSYLNNNLGNIQPINGVEELFGLLKTKNIPFGVASNASKHFVTQCLKNWNLKVDVCYGYEDYVIPKPNPEPYLKLANFFEIDKQNYNDILVFEDSETGLLSALDAKMKVARIKSHCNVSTEILNSVHCSFNSVFEAISLID